MPRPFTLRQAHQNRAFLDALAQTGNARLAARGLGLHRSTYTKRRAKCAAFAQDWDAAVAAAHARFHLSGGRRPPEACPERRESGTRAPEGEGRGNRGIADFRTKGGEPHVVRLKSGRLQLRLAPPGRMTKAGEQAFLAALSASANVRLSAAAAGFAHSSFYARRRERASAFAREMRLALTMGYDRLEAAALAAALPESHADDEWRQRELPPIPPMSADQALQLLFLHEKSVRQGWEQPHRRRRRNESDARYAMRLFLMWRAEQRQVREEAAGARAERYMDAGDWRFADELPPPPLPPLETVTGWSRAKAGPKHDPDVALFGGWRLAQMRARRGEKG